MELGILEATYTDSIETGFPELDKALDGGIPWLGSTVIAGRPAIGKTALAISMAVNMAKNGEKVAYISLGLEGKKNFAARMASVALGRSFLESMDGCYTAEDWEALHKVAKNIDYVVFPPERFDAVDLVNVASGSDVVFLDYADLIPTKSLSREMRGMFCAAKECAFSLVVLSQVSRFVDMREPDDRKPRLGEINNYEALGLADAFLLLSRDDYYSPKEEDSTMHVDVVRGGWKRFPVAMRFRKDNFGVESTTGGESK